MFKALIFSTWLLNFSQISFGQAIQKIYTGALGDSMTAGLNADAPFDQRDRNWSDGKEIDSHAVRLAKKFGVEVISKNVSVSGSRIDSLASQTAKLLDDNYKPDYVTILIGANNICDGDLKPDELSAIGKNQLSDSIQALIRANENIKVIIGAIPKINFLYELLHEDTTCQENWRTFNVCYNLLQSTKFEREKGIVRWNAYNEIQKEVAAMYPKNVKFTSRLSDEIFTVEDISRIDCFHPNMAGQKKMAEVTWQDGWFPDLRN